MATSYKVVGPRGEIDAKRIGFVNLTDGTGRVHITVKSASGEAENVGLIGVNGSVEPQPGYEITAE